MEQVVLVFASVYNNSSFGAQTVTKQELPTYQTEQNPRYQIHLLRKEMNKKIVAKAHSIMGRILSCRRIKLLSSHTLILDGVEIGLLLSDFLQNNLS